MRFSGPAAADCAIGRDAQALRCSGETALVFEGRAITFAEVYAVASRIANALIESGVRTQERIAYLSKNTDHFLPYLLDACKARAALTPLNFRLAAPEIACLRTVALAQISPTSPTRRLPRSLE
jgi:acyl-CoA synthetase (AMP-forming)/AMP-acid ligase II